MSTPLAFPPGPSWVIVNLDNVLSLPLIGQYDPELKVQKGAPIWQTKPGIAGAPGWLKHVGTGLGFIEFTFRATGLTILDPYPELAFLRLKEMAAVDSTLGRPPRVAFNHGLKVFQGFITGLPPMPVKYWGPGGTFGPLVSKIVREYGPATIRITLLPESAPLLSFGTNFVTRTEDTLFEEAARTQYGDARYAQSLDFHNQGVKVEETLELPRKSSGKVSTSLDASPYFDDAIEGL